MFAAFGLYITKLVDNIAALASGSYRMLLQHLLFISDMTPSRNWMQESDSN